MVRPKDANLAASVTEAFKRNVSVLVLADIGTLPRDLKERVDEWVKKGGVLVRFAGPRLEKGGDDLLPVGLRLGGRTLGGALSWSTPQPLAPFDDGSLFAGLAMPPELLVNRQVLADPARLGAGREGMGAPEGRHAARHGRQARRGPGRPFPRHRQLRLVEPAAVGPVRGDAAAHYDARPQRRCCRRRRRDADTPADASLTAEVLDPIQVLDGFGTLETAAAHGAGDRGRAHRYVQAERRASAGLLWTGKHPARAQCGRHENGAEAVARPGRRRRAARLRGRDAQPLKPQLLRAALALLFIDIVAVLLLQAGPVRPPPRGACGRRRRRLRRRRRS